MKNKLTNIYIIRHCQPDYEKVKDGEDTDMMPLSAHGKKQRRQLTLELLKICKIKKIYASGFTRSYETARELSEKLGIKIQTHEELEEINWKEWQKVKYFHMSESTRMSRFKNYEDLDEKLDKAQSVARRIISQIYHNNKGKDIAVFTHGNVIRSMITGILNADVIGFLSMEIYQGSINKITIDAEEHIKMDYVNNWFFMKEKPMEDLFKN